MNVGAADRSFLNPNEDIVIADFRHRHFFQPKARFGLPFDQRLHRLLHAQKIDGLACNEIGK